MIKAVIFDIDGVLIDSFDANHKFVQDLMVRTGYKPPTKKEYIPLFHMSIWDVIKTITKLSSEEKIAEIWEIARTRSVKYPRHLLVVPKQTEIILKILSKKYSLGVVTNRVREGFYGVPELSNLKNYFSAIITYQDTKNHKPHPEPLLLTCNKLKVNPKYAVYIGDQESDIIAGKAAGMKTILCAKNKIDKPDLYTSRLEELPKLIRVL